MSSSEHEAVSFRWNAVCIDCSPDSYDREVAFYRDLLDTEVAEREERWAALQDPQSGMWLNIQADDSYVPPVWPDEPSRQGKMIHLEVRVADVQSAASRAASFGAREAAWQPPDRDSRRLRVMLDPAGHPFCLWN